MQHFHIAVLMLQVTPHIRILVARHPIDFRKGMDGIARTCQEALGEDPFSGTYFIFRNRRKTGLKILIYDGQGFWLCHKRLSKGQFNIYPSNIHVNPDKLCAKSHVEKFEELHGGTKISLHPNNYY